MLQVPLRTVSKLCCGLLRTVTFCHVLLVHPVLLRPARFLIRTVTARFLHGGLKRGRRGHREPSVNLALVFVGNLMIIIHLTKARRQREAMNSGIQQQTGANSTTVMLIATSITFLITTLPLTIYLYKQTKWFDLTHGTEKWNVRSLAFATLTQLYYTNSMINC